MELELGLGLELELELGLELELELELESEVGLEVESEVGSEVESEVGSEVEVDVSAELSPVNFIAGSIDDVLTLGVAIDPGEMEEGELFDVFVNESHGIVFILSVYRIMIYFTTIM